MNPKKPLPIPISKEFWIKIDYAIIKSMKTGKVIRGKPFGKNFIFTVKPVKTPKLPKKFRREIQLHIRISDEKTGDDWDMDAYVLPREFGKIEEAIKYWRAKGIEMELEPKDLPFIVYFYGDKLIRASPTMELEGI